MGNSSNLYGYRISFTLDFSNNQRPEHRFNPIYDPSIATFTLTFEYYTDTFDWAVYVNLTHQIFPKVSKLLKASYYYLPYSDNPFKIECDTCVKFIGAVSQGNKTYQEVYEYINPVLLGVDSRKKAPQRMLYETKKGLIQVHYKNGEKWYLLP